MQKTNIENLINAIKLDPNTNAIFWDNVVYQSLFNDVVNIALLIQPISYKMKWCLNIELVQFQIIDKEDSSTTLQMKEYTEILDTFLISQLKTLDGFETVSISTMWAESLDMNNNSRYVMSKIYRFAY